jgi:hypothetical protein
MVLRIMTGLIAMGLSISISGCACQRYTAPGDARVRTFAENYRRSKEARYAEREEATSVELKISEETGYVKPYLPVVLPPEVIKVWVPAHAATQDKRVLVSGHWAFVMLNEADWYIGSEITEGLTIPMIVPSKDAKEE